MKVLYWGTPHYAVPTLKAIHAAGHEIVGVVSQPDRRRGRGQQIIPSPVKDEAIKLGLRVFTPERIRRDLDCQQKLAELGADISVVVAFGQILPAEILNQPPLGCWNGHGSLLPRWRGAAPIQWSILEGDQETGVGVMAMEEGLDTGPVLLEQRIPLGLLDNATVIGERLSDLTAKLMLEALPVIGSVGPGSSEERLKQLGVRQQNGESCYARLLAKQDFELNWSQSALATHRRVMGLYPNAVTTWKGKRLKITSSEPLIERLKQQLSQQAADLVGRWKTGSYQPGTVLDVIENLGFVVSSSGCPLLVKEAQIEGKRRSREGVLAQQMNSAIGDLLG